MNSLAALMAALPKTELHLHLEGSVLPETLIDLAKKNNVQLPDYKEPADLYKFDNDLAAFLTVYNLVCESIVDESDFERVTFECLANCNKNGARYVELFFSPQAHYPHGVSYLTCLTGIRAGLKRAYETFSIECQLIPGINREKSPDENHTFLNTILQHPCKEIVGIGLDYYEAPFPPELHTEIFKLAKKKGLRLTAHAGEAGPASNVKASVDILGCERIDHGYHIVDNPEMLADFAKRNVFFTACPSTSTITTRWHDLSDDNHAIKRMINAGLKVTINSDDPPMMGTNLTNEYMLMVKKMGFSLSDIKTFILNGVLAAWLPEDKKEKWYKSWSAEIDRLIADYIHIHDAKTTSNAK